MQLEYDEINDITEVVLEPNEICYDCYISDKCPLVGALQHNCVAPTEIGFKIEVCELKV